jgi:hypothetical protein
MNDLVLEEDCILIGVLFKQMILKPSIVKQLATEVNEFPKQKRNLFVWSRMVLIYNHHVNVMLIQLIN